MDRGTQGVVRYEEKKPCYGSLPIPIEIDLCLWYPISHSVSHLSQNPASKQTLFNNGVLHKGLMRDRLVTGHSTEIKIIFLWALYLRSKSNKLDYFSSKNGDYLLCYKFIECHVIKEIFFDLGVHNQGKYIERKHSLSPSLINYYLNKSL